MNAAGAASAWLEPYPSATALTPAPATTDRGALVALYESTGGADWTRSHNWLTDAPLSD